MSHEKYQVPQVRNVYILSGLSIRLTAQCEPWNPAPRMTTLSGSPTGWCSQPSLWLSTSLVGTADRLHSAAEFSLKFYFCRLHCRLDSVLLAFQVYLHGLVHGSNGEQRLRRHLLQVRHLPFCLVVITPFQGHSSSVPEALLHH